MQDRVNSIIQLLRAIQVEASSPYSDGWLGSESKKDLIMIRYELDKMIKSCPTFSDEGKWEQEILMKILKEK